MSCSLIRQSLNRIAFLPGQLGRTSRLRQAVRLAATDVAHDAKKDWRGLRRPRQSGTSAKDKRCRGTSYVFQNAVFDSILKSCAKNGDAALAMQYLRTMRAFERKYLPDAQTTAAILETIVTAAPGDLKADAAIGAMLRLKDNFAVHISAPLLTVVASAARLDPVVENRSKRVFSIIQLMRRDRIAPTPMLVRACFDTCIAGLDVPSALAFMQFARSAGIAATSGSVASLKTYSQAGPTSGEERNTQMQEGHFSAVHSELPYYNGIVKASILSGKHDAAAAALREMSALGIGGDRESLSLLAALYADTGCDENASRVLTTIRSRGEYPTSVAYAAMIRLAGMREKAPAALMLFEEFEQYALNSDDESGFHAGLSTVSSVQTSASGPPSKLALHAARDDVVLAMFQTLRTLGETDRALAFLEHLRSKYSFVPTRTILMILCETCWRSVPQRLDVVDQLRSEMDGILATKKCARDRPADAKSPRRKAKSEEVSVTQRKKGRKDSRERDGAIP